MYCLSKWPASEGPFQDGKMGRPKYPTSHYLRRHCPDMPESTGGRDIRELIPSPSSELFSVFSPESLLVIECECNVQVDTTRQ